MDLVLSKYPRIVELESPPRLFLRASRGDASLAAAKLAKYWEHRQSLFLGQERFLKPMTSTWRGALTGNDVDVLHSGFIANLPPISNNGRPVVCYDRSRLEKDFLEHDLANILPRIARCIF